MASASLPEAATDQPQLVLLGGSFDPVHHGHLRSAVEAAQALGAEQCTLLPAASPALRNPLSASPEQRLAMLRLAIDDDQSLCIDDRELIRGGDTFTVDTLHGLREQWPRRSIVFLLGADAFARISRWRQWQRLLELAHLGVLTRPGQALQPPDQAHFTERYCDDPQALARTTGGTWCSIAVTPLAISATAIRAHLAAGLSARFLLPDRVLDYIRSEQLYRR